MFKTYLYIPDNLEDRIKRTAELQKKSKAEVMRQALEKGLVSVQHQGTASAEVLLKIAELGKKNNVKGPKNSSTRMDEYLWDKDWDEK